MNDDAPKCDKCGLEITTGAMAAFCPQAFDCEFWPHSNGDKEAEGGELLMSRMWINNALEQIGLQIEDRKRLESERDEARRALSEVTRDLEYVRYALWRELGERVTYAGQLEQMIRDAWEHRYNPVDCEHRLAVSMSFIASSPTMSATRDAS